MTKLLLTQVESNALRAISTHEKNVTLLNLLTELGIQVEINDTAAAAERVLVLADPAMLRKFVTVTPQQYYELFLIYEAQNGGAPEVFQNLMGEVSGVLDVGFPIYLFPQAAVVQVPRVCATAFEYTVFIENGRPSKAMTVSAYDDAGVIVGAPSIVACDEAGKRSFTFTAPAGATMTIETVQEVVSAAESTTVAINHTMLSSITLTV